jgi:NAD(P)H-flavin reductase/ferredoxin
MIKRLQSGLQWLFMRVEAVFNAAFGDRLNPLYHLGSISFFLFWVITATGLYVYAFFETGVPVAYTSVESLTHGQWFAGGLMRSIHRYASDAFVITMLLHMVRHFAFNRLRGFRWFSWVTGVFLIWLVYAAGVTGFMLPWDHLAQYTIIASFEWLDWLPGFGGALMRNFIYADSVTDRFFSLLAFMHIGISLVLLLLQWVHVQRVPKARTNPPRVIMTSLLVTLLLLSIARPVLSQGGVANLAEAVTTLHFDWFYLAVLPLITVWPIGQMWALLGASTALLLLLPWLPPRFGRQRQQAFQLEVHTTSGNAEPLAVRPGETLLDAALRNGLELPYECRNGGCGVCICTVLHGDIDQGPYQPSALPDAARARGQALMCCATARSDVVIEVETDAVAARNAVQEYVARVDSIERLAPEVIRLMLSLPDGQTVSFKAGQYINIILEDGQRRAFSFANPPQQRGHIELHVRRVPGGRFTGDVFTTMKVGDSLRFEGPLGQFTLNESRHPILFVAGATGFAPIKSIVEDAFARGLTRQMWLYWGVRKRDDLYAMKLAEQWQREHANFRFIPVLSEADPADAWRGRTGLVHEAMLADFPDLREHEVYVCGSVKMVEAAVPAFIEQGLGEGFCFTDAFLPSAMAPGAGQPTR